MSPNYFCYWLILPLICASSPIEMVKNSYRKNLSRENLHCYRDVISSTLPKKVVLSLLRMNKKPETSQSWNFLNEH